MTADGNSHLAIKKAILDRRMLLNKLQEEERILVQEMKRHSGSLQRVVGTLEALSLHLQEQSNAVELSERGRNGLLCHLKRRLSEPTQDQDNSTYHKLILGEGAHFDDSDVDENSDKDCYAF